MVPSIDRPVQKLHIIKTRNYCAVAAGSVQPCCFCQVCGCLCVSQMPCVYLDPSIGVGSRHKFSLLDCDLVYRLSRTLIWTMNLRWLRFSGKGLICWCSNEFWIGLSGRRSPFRVRPLHLMGVPWLFLWKQIWCFCGWRILGLWWRLYGQLWKMEPSWFHVNLPNLLGIRFFQINIPAASLL